MTHKIVATLSIAAASLALAACGGDATTSSDSSSTTTPPASASSSSSPAASSSSSTSASPSASSSSDTGTAAPASSKGSYIDYDAYKKAGAQDGVKTVLFFHAAWCPSCKSADAALKDAGVPDGIQVVKVDFDGNADVKKKYGITQQHTFVQVDKDGKQLGKWSGSQSGKDIAEKVA